MDGDSETIANRDSPRVDPARHCEGQITAKMGRLGGEFAMREEDIAGICRSVAERKLEHGRGIAPLKLHAETTQVSTSGPDFKFRKTL